jgi:hypothetical protein
MQDHSAGQADDRANENANRRCKYEAASQSAKSRSERQAQNKSIVQLVALPDGNK